MYLSQNLKSFDDVSCPQRGWRCYKAANRPLSSLQLLLLFCSALRQSQRDLESDFPRFRLLHRSPPPPLLTQEQNASHFKRSSASIINLCPLIPLLYDLPAILP